MVNVSNDTLHEFMRFLKEEMSWNAPDISYNPQTDEIDYLGMPGGGLTKYIREAIKKFDQDLKAKVTRGYTGRRADEHDYYIKIWWK